MTDIAVLDSNSRPIDFETFTENLDGYTTERVTLESADIRASIGSEYDLSGYRAIYLRVGRITENVLDSADNLEIIATCGSGYDHIDVEAATERGVVVAHTPEAPAPGAIEHAFGFIFLLLNRFPEIIEETSSGGRGKGQTVVEELCGRTVGVVGLGTIGYEVAKTAQNRFGADVVAYDPYVAGQRESDIYPRVSRAEVESHGIELTDKQNLFESASLVTMHVPLTYETRKMVSTAELNALEDSYFVNLSRGEVVDEDALITAVEQETLRGVALDVLQNEPPEPSNPLLSSPRVYVTPHIAGGKEGYITRSAKINAERIPQALDGKHPDKIVNPRVFSSP
jgi:D-3-phosphoglycerate dehydrogenase